MKNNDDSERVARDIQERIVDGLLEENVHCAKPATDTLQNALRNYLGKGW